MPKIEELLTKAFEHPKVGPVLIKIVEADPKEAEKVSTILSTIVISYTSRVFVNRALVDLGLEKKQARRLTYGAVCAAYLLGSNFRTGANAADKIAAMRP